MAPPAPVLLGESLGPHQRNTHQGNTHQQPGLDVAHLYASSHVLGPQLSPAPILMLVSDLPAKASEGAVFLIIFKNNKKREIAKLLGPNTVLCSQKSVHSWYCHGRCVREWENLINSFFESDENSLSKQAWKHTGKNPSIYLY